VREAHADETENPQPPRFGGAEEKIMKKIGPRLSDQAAEWYEKNFATRGGGAEFILEAFPTLWKQTLAELRGKFTVGEINLLIDTFNSTLLAPNLLGQHVELCAHDSMRLDGSDEKWGVAHDEFMAKLKNLSLFEKACLEIFVRAFWESGEWENPDGVDSWVGKIAEAEARTD